MSAGGEHYTLCCVCLRRRGKKKKKSWGSHHLSLSVVLTWWSWIPSRNVIKSEEKQRAIEVSRSGIFLNQKCNKSSPEWLGLGRILAPLKWIGPLALTDRMRSLEVWNTWNLALTQSRDSTWSAMRGKGLTGRENSLWHFKPFSPLDGSPLYGWALLECFFPPLDFLKNPNGLFSSTVSCSSSRANSEYWPAMKGIPKSIQLWLWSAALELIAINWKWKTHDFKCGFTIFHLFWREEGDCQTSLYSQKVNILNV